MTRTKSTVLTILVPIIGMVCVPVGATAGTVGAKAASDLISISPASPPNACVNNGFAKVDTLASSDGSKSLFVIPDGEVLVVTAITASVVGGAANAAALGALFRDSPTPDIIAAASFTNDASGNGSGTVTLPTGVAVKAGVTLCAAPGVDLWVYGYLTKDK